MIEYNYDPIGRRREKVDNFGTTTYLWSGDQMVQEERNQIKKTYIYEPNSFKPVAMVEGEKVYHYHLDHLGTPQELSDNEGNIVWQARYKTYGNVAVKAIEEVENNLRFQGQYFDEESGLHYNRHRYYNPSTGTFTTQDPIGLLGGVNNYQYAPNPVGWIDPFGLSCKEERPSSVITAPSRMIDPPKWDTLEHPNHAIESIVTNEDIFLEQAIDGNYQIDKITEKVKPGGFFTTANTILDEQYLRNELAVTHNMKSQVTHVAIFKFPSGIRLQISSVNPQVDIDGSYLKGGAPQMEVLNYEDRKKIELTSLREIE